jgi:acetyl esterase
VRLDPQIAGLIETLDAGFPAVHTMTGAQARAVIRSRFVPAAEPVPVAEVRDQTIEGPGGDIAIRIYRSVGAGLPVIVYAHGGGFVFCDLDSHDGLCRDIANHVPAVVVSVAYRLAPEHRWPAAADDFYAATQWAVRNASSLGGDSGQVVVAGDSAGGNLAAVAALMARDRGGPALAAQVLLYPVLAADFDTESYRLFGRGYYNPTTAMRWYWDQYVTSETDRAHPYATPLNADLNGLPPAVLAIAGHDPLRDEALAYAAALEAAGAHVVCAQFDGAVHGFMSMPILDIALQARRRVCEELSGLLGRTPGCDADQRMP